MSLRFMVHNSPIMQTRNSLTMVLPSPTTQYAAATRYMGMCVAVYPPLGVVESAVERGPREGRLKRRSVDVSSSGVHVEDAFAVLHQPARCGVGCRLLRRPSRSAPESRGTTTQLTENSAGLRARWETK